MLGGDKPEACSDCAGYSNHFNTRFEPYLQEIKNSTAPDGATSFKPISYDYRVSQVCNLTCRTCCTGNSSAWETEQRLRLKYLFPLKRLTFSKEKDAIADLRNGVDAGLIKEIYWVGGEPLMMLHHWKIMNKIIESDLDVHVRYNTNFTNLNFKNQNFITDILAKLKSFTVQVSIDGYGETCEYVRYGTSWMDLERNILSVPREYIEAKQFFLDCTLTIPGLVDFARLIGFAERCSIPILLKPVLSLSSLDQHHLSPSILPFDILKDEIDKALLSVAKMKGDRYGVAKVLLAYLENYIPPSKKALTKYVKTILEFDKMKRSGGAQHRFVDVVSRSPRVLEWWNSEVNKIS
jgi:hypothetical protein